MNFINPFAFLANYFTRRGDAQNAKIGHVNAVIEELNNLSGPTYTSYVALLSQQGTDDPTANVLFNNLGTDIVWTRNNPGEYIGTLDFNINFEKTYLSITENNGGLSSIHIFSNGGIIHNSLCIMTKNDQDLDQDDLLNLTSVEIRIYP